MRATTRQATAAIVISVFAAAVAPLLAQSMLPVQLRPEQIQQAMSETQLQTAAFGTPEATAAIAAKAGFLDVVGIKLGTPLKAALAALKAHNPNLVMQPLAMPPYEALPGTTMAPLLMSAKGTNTSSADEKEHVGLLATTPPGESFVWGMWREVSYEKEDSRPTVETIMAGLRKKYGQESTKDASNNPIWMYDAQGQQVPAAKTNEIMAKCVSTWTVGLSMPLSQAQWGYFNRQIVGGYFNASYGRDSMNGLCLNYSHVTASLDVRISSKSSPPLVASVRVVAMNRQLEASGVTASHGLLIREATRLAEQRNGQAGKREVPKF